jgi:hypothetical protein
MLALTGSALAAATSAGAAGPTTPSANQVQAALARAERSAGLWATINICNTK